MRMKKVLITGGTGSLGRKLVNRVKKAGWHPIVFSRDEGKQALLFGNDKDVTRVIGDVRDLNKLETTFKLHKPDYVIHAAALKRVDDMELFPDECVKTNVQGSENVAIAALGSGVEKCILVSTDKACQPVNVYGSSKFIAERIYTNYDYNSTDTIFASVRYGNVIASRGSFIPLWINQIEEKGQITVTSHACSRFLFTLEDAVDTVLNALSCAEGGEVFIPKISSYDMNTVIDVVKKITKKEDFDIVDIGLRPGEKLHEDMLAETELPFTYEVDDNLMVVIPQYTRKQHSYKNKYDGLHYNSSLHLNSNVDDLLDIVIKGIKQ
jgi:UDP-N-acetylglucosamine 4,6-dehydratase